MLKELQILQNKAARLVCRSPPRSNRSALLQKLGWLSMNQLIAFQSLITVFRIRQFKEPKYLATLMCNDTQNGRIMLMNSNLTLTSKSFCFRGPSLWNQLPRNVRSEEKLGIFKNMVKKWTLDNVPQFLEWFSSTRTNFNFFILKVP